MNREFSHLPDGSSNVWAVLPDLSGGFFCHLTARVADGVSSAVGGAGGICTRRGMID